MSFKITRAAYEQLLKDDLDWLRKQPDCAENAHVRCIVADSVEAYYPPLPEGHPTNQPPSLLTLLNELRVSLEKAEQKHGPMKSAHEGYSVILEELDELWTEVKAQHIDHAQLRKEALHVAAMALRFIKDVCDRVEEPYRAFGYLKCDMCKRELRDHPMALEAKWLFNGEPYLHRLCNGALVKL